MKSRNFKIHCLIICFLIFTHVLFSQNNNNYLDTNQIKKSIYNEINDKYKDRYDIKSIDFITTNVIGKYNFGLYSVYFTKNKSNASLPIIQVIYIKGKLIVQKKVPGYDLKKCLKLKKKLNKYLLIDDVNKICDCFKYREYNW